MVSNQIETTFPSITSWEAKEVAMWVHSGQWDTHNSDVWSLGHTLKRKFFANHHLSPPHCWLRYDHSTNESCILRMFSSVQLLSHVWLFATPWTVACQASLSITNSQSLPKIMSIEMVMPSSHHILCCPLLLLPSIFPSITVFSNESALHIRWPNYWCFSLNISPSNEHPGLISFRMNWLDLLAVQGTLKSLP